MMITRMMIQMTKNRFITIDQPKRGFMVMNEDDKVLTICSDCIDASDIPGKVKNKEDCKHKDEFK